MRSELLRILALLSCFVSTTAFSQSVLRGTLTDSLTNEPLIGANVLLIGTSLGASTDIEGHYRIANIPDGSYSVRFSYVGYRSESRDVIFDGAELTISMSLAPEVIEGQEVVVLGQARGQIAAINQQMSAKTIMNVISEEKIQELPDANAAEAIGRLPGVSLLRSGGEANKVIMRGLSDKFSSVMIDGVKIPSTEVDERGVDLSTISQGSLAGVELYKALTPNLDADAIAGTINLVTKRAPEEQLMRADVRGDYNRLMNAYDQYDVSVKYGERFFSGLLGIQINANAERRNRSNERLNINYNYQYGLDTAGRSVADYEITNLLLEFTDEIRTRQGVGLLLDYFIDEDNSIRLNTIYGGTKRDYLYTTRNYPYGTGTTGLVTYTTRDVEQRINTFNNSLQGTNLLLGFNITWGISFAQSLTDFPYDYYLDFLEPSIIQNGQQVSGMGSGEKIRSNPELLIPYAFNNYQLAYTNWAYYRERTNFDKDRVVSFDINRPFALTEFVTGEFRIGAKYKEKGRYRNDLQRSSPYYLGYWRDYMFGEDGSIVLKAMTGTLFEEFYQRFVSSGGTARTPFASDFLGSGARQRDIFGMYALRPLFDRQRLRAWYSLNKNGVDSQGKTLEFYDDPTAQTNDYNVLERIGAGFAMGTINVGTAATIMMGGRMERENNIYGSRYSPTSIGGFPPSGIFKDTVASHTETIWLPHLHITLRPADFLQIRLAAFRALARPDFNLRLEKYVASGGGGAVALLVGNPHLKAAKAMNYEANISLVGGEFGLISVSGFYKDIKQMFHILSNAGTSGDYILDSLGINWNSPFQPGTEYSLTVPYTSSKPTRVWGLEFEHQMNFNLFSGFLRNLVLSYNFSLVRSETFVLATQRETTYVIIPGFPPLPTYRNKLIQNKQKLEDQPEFYGNISLGFDTETFSARVSVFHQGEFNTGFSASSLNDAVNEGFTRVDAAFKQALGDRLSIMLNINNLTSVEEGTSQLNREQGWRLANTRERYGTTVDLGLRFTL